MKVIDLSQRTPAWHQWRIAGVTASEAPIIMGRSPYKTPWRLWAEKPDSYYRKTCRIIQMCFAVYGWSLKQGEHLRMRIMTFFCRYVQKPIITQSFEPALMASTMRANPLN